MTDTFKTTDWYRRIYNTACVHQVSDEGLVSQAVSLGAEEAKARAAVAYMMRSEEQIERTAERRMDAADRAYMAGRMTEEQYNAVVRTIDQWCEVQYSHLPRYREE